VERTQEGREEAVIRKNAAALSGFGPQRRGNHLSDQTASSFPDGSGSGRTDSADSQERRPPREFVRIV
jgi:hypothetical protein